MTSFWLNDISFSKLHRLLFQSCILEIFLKLSRRPYCSTNIDKLDLHASESNWHVIGYLINQPWLIFKDRFCHNLKSRFTVLPDLVTKCRHIFCEKSPFHTEKIAITKLYLFRGITSRAKTIYDRLLYSLFWIYRVFSFTK